MEETASFHLPFTIYHLLFPYHPSPITSLKVEDEMTDQDKSEDERGRTPKESKTGDPGRTPGKAEGDEEIVDESIREKENKPLH